LASEYLHSSVWNGWDFFPTLNLTYTPKPGNILSFGLSSERTCPDYWTVGDFTSYINGGYGEIVGNPNLQPSRDYNATLSYVLHGKYFFAAWYAMYKRKLYKIGINISSDIRDISEWMVVE